VWWKEKCWKMALHPPPPKLMCWNISLGSRSANICSWSGLPKMDAGKWYWHSPQGTKLALQTARYSPNCPTGQAVNKSRDT
jgi:hypothetical protein